MMLFKDPWVIALIPIALGFIVFLRKKQKSTNFRFSSTDITSSLNVTWKVKFQRIPYLLRLIVIILLFVALAGPRSVLEETIHQTEGIDIVLTIDSSGSMAAEDFVLKGRRYNRLAIVKKVVEEFIDERTNDRIGIVTFARAAYTVSPLTTDHSWLLENFKRIELGMIDGTSTAIGSAIASSVGRLKSSDAKSKIMILLTDGTNNAGKISPTKAAEIAKAFDIKIYTIGVGTKGLAPVPRGRNFRGQMMYVNQRVDIDEETLKEIADITGGKYFRATDTESLRSIYKEIDALEKIKIEEQGYREYKELFSYFLIAALMMFFLEVVLAKTVFLKVP